MNGYDALRPYVQFLFQSIRIAASRKRKQGKHQKTGLGPFFGGLFLINMV